MSEYSDAISQQRRARDRREANYTRRMLRAYDDLLDSLDDDLREITDQIEEARANGEDVHPDWLRRQARYARLMDQVRLSSDTFMALGTNIIVDASGSEVEHGAIDALERSRILFPGEVYFPEGDIFSGNINLPALENLIGQTSGSSPLIKVLESHGNGAGEIITSGLIAGLTGQGADEIFRNIRRQLQSPVADSRLMALVRTEMMNAYRASMHEQYGQFGDEIDGWMWSAHRGPRTCLACLAMDGRVFPMDQPFDQAHVNCRCSASPWPTDLFPEVQAFLQQQGSGEDWIRRQPRDVQAKMFPSHDAFAAFERGDLHLMDFVGYTDSPQWGRKIYQVSGRQAMQNGGVTPPPKATPKPTFKKLKSDVEIEAWTDPFAKPWLKNLTKRQIAGLDSYRGNGYRPINNHLRKDAPIASFEKRSIGTIDRAIAKSQLPENVLGYRAVGDGVFTKKTAVGDIVPDKGFMSMSLSENEGVKFLNYIKHHNNNELYFVHISVPSGTNAAYMDALNGHGDVYLHEKEILLERNTKLVVTGIKPMGWYTQIEAEVLP